MSARYYTFLLVIAATFLSGPLRAQVPQLVNYQGRVAVDAVNFEGAGQFRFALVNSDGTVTFWSNDGTSVDGSEPAAAVTLTVARGLYSLLLGDTALGNMTAIPASVFTNPDVRLRVWFDDGTNGSQLLSPDQRLAPATYLADGTVTTASIANGAVTGSNIAPASIDGTNIAPGSLDFTHLTVPVAPGAGQVLGFDGNTLNWVAPGAGDGIWALNGTNTFYNGGNVGIGTSAPATALEINGILRSTRIGTASQSIQLNGGDSGSIKLTAQSTVSAEKNLFIQNLSGEVTPGANNNIQFDLGTTAAPSTKMTISRNGNVGIGIVNPGFRLTVNAGSNAFGIAQTDGTATVATLVGNNSSGTLGGWLGTQTNHPLFLFANIGQPKMTLLPNGNVGIGTLIPSRTLEVNGDFYARDASVRVLTIRGGADLAEPFQMKEEELEKGSVVVIDSEHPGWLKRSKNSYDRRVAGIVSGANGVNPGIALQQEGVMERGQNVALSGRVYVQADASTGAIKPGDMLTTSDTPGHAMKVRDHSRAQGAVIGKAMSALEAGTGMVLVLVTLQ
jgi:hypothetical protein